jgi:TPP-dependent pyruvate/acetoin dehydrogenase alpha subunit
MVDSDYATTEDIKTKEKEIRKMVQKEVALAKESPKPGLEELTMHIYAADLTPNNQAYPPYVRMPDQAKSLTFPK